MGKDDAYYFLWRLLLPEHLAAQKAFGRMSDTEKSNHLPPTYERGDGQL